MQSPFYSASVVLFQLHGVMVSHMQALATPSSTLHITVEPLLSGLLRCGHLPLPDIIKNRVVFVLFVFVKSIWSGHPVWSRERAWRLSYYAPCYISYIVLVSLASTTRRKRSVLTLEKKLEIIGELKKGKSLRCVSMSLSQQ